MADDTPGERSSRALIEVSGDLADRFRDPRLVLAFVAGVAGAVAIFVGWLGISDTLEPGRQLPYLISGGVGGLFLLGLAAALLFSADVGAARRDLRATLDAVEDLRSRVDELHARLDAGSGENGRAPAKATKAKKKASTRRRSTSSTS